MTLAGMIALDETALICDFAETYNIYDYKALPVKYAAALASGLGDNSRIKIKARGEKAPRETILAAIIADRLGMLLYAMGGGKGKQPPLISEKFIDTDETEKPETFASGAEFMSAWNK